MHAKAIDVGGGVATIRPLRAGDTATVQAVFDRLGERSRRLRFGYAKETLSASDLELLARVDGGHHVLVASVDGEPVGIARLVRGQDPASAEVAFAVADDWQRRGIGTALVKLLAADAAAAGILRLHAMIQPGNRASLSLMHAATTVETSRIEDGELHVVGLAA